MLLLAGLFAADGQEACVVVFQGDEPGNFYAKGKGAGGAGNGRRRGFEAAPGFGKGFAESGFGRLDLAECGSGAGLDGPGLGTGHLEPLLQKARCVLLRSHGSASQGVEGGRGAVADSGAASERAVGRGAAAEHFGPTVAEDFEAQECFLDRLLALFEVGIAEGGCRSNCRGGGS